ncbi:MAG: UDP-3-O-(3-hydroxymyristoyl)glucosamine N-acyltransferase [Planctomycetes bacterium]|nr:UDP-3-O-(3-hydroxymyristoyl)glucosamine N-acyltransferase [Planctomycetota bacterium]
MPSTEPRQFTVQEIAKLCDAKIVDQSRAAMGPILRVATLTEADQHSVSWISSSKYAGELETTKAAAVLGSAESIGSHSAGLIVSDPESAIATLLDVLYGKPHAPAVGIHPTAVVDPSVKLAEDCAIGALATIGPGSKIGNRTLIHEGVSLGADVVIGNDCVVYDRCVIYDRCEVGNRVILHAGVVIGGDGFGYIFRDGRHRKLMHVGSVVIEDDVEVGANSCIDRGKLGATRIGRGTKIDNLVQIAHNAQIGPLSILVAQTGIAGSVTSGVGVIYGGPSGVKEGVTVRIKPRSRPRRASWRMLRQETPCSEAPPREFRQPCAKLPHRGSCHNSSSVFQRLKNE